MNIPISKYNTLQIYMVIVIAIIVALSITANIVAYCNA